MSLMFHKYGYSISNIFNLHHHSKDVTTFNSKDHKAAAPTTATILLHVALACSYFKKVQTKLTIMMKKKVNYICLQNFFFKFH